MWGGKPQKERDRKIGARQQAGDFPRVLAAQCRLSEAMPRHSRKAAVTIVCTVWRVLLGLFAALALSTSPAAAHNLAYTVARAAIAVDGGFEITLNFHTAAFLLGEPQAHLSAEVRERWAACCPKSILPSP